MDRIETVRNIVDGILLNMKDDEERRCAYLHLYGVAQACAMLAIKRKENVELAIIAGMLHDIYSYANMDPNDHAHKGAEMARNMLNSTNAFREEEINVVCTAIYNHRDKLVVQAPLDELLKDADVMQHVLYNPLCKIKEEEEKRFSSLKMEFGLGK